MNYLLTVNNVLSKYLIFIILGFSCIAYIVPEYFTWAIAYTPFLLGIAMFGMGLTIKFESVSLGIQKIFVLVYLHNIR